MKKTLLSLCVFLLPFMMWAQKGHRHPVVDKVIQTHQKEYCVMSQTFGPGERVRVDYGKPVVKARQNTGEESTEKVLDFTNLVDAMNYMNTLGWEVDAVTTLALEDGTRKQIWVLYRIVVKLRRHSDLKEPMNSELLNALQKEHRHATMFELDMVKCQLHDLCGEFMTGECNERDGSSHSEYYDSNAYLDELKDWADHFIDLAAELKEILFSYRHGVAEGGLLDK